MRIALTFIAVILLSTVALNAQDSHKFFDRQNVILFSAIATVRTLDVHSTWVDKYGVAEVFLPQNLTDSEPGFIAFSAGMGIGGVAISYWFHKRGWHKAERILSYVHIGTVGYAAYGNYRIQGVF